MSAEEVVTEKGAGGMEYIKRIHSMSTPAWAAGIKAIACKCDYCHRSLGFRHFSSRKVGLTIRGRWYCSSLCLKSVIADRIAGLLSSAPVERGYVSRMPLGLILISRGLLTNEQLKQAKAEHKESGDEIGEVLVRQGAVTEQQVAAVRAAQWGCPVFATPKLVVRTGVQIPSSLFRPNSMIPLHYITATKSLMVGFVSSIEYGLLYAIEQIAGCKTEPCFITRSEFELQMEQHQQLGVQTVDGAPKEADLEGTQSARDMAESLSDYAFESQAVDILFAKVKKRIWARVKCETRAFDMVFSPR